MEICSGTGHMGEQEIMLLNRWLRRAEDKETGLPFLIVCMKSKITVSRCRYFNVEKKLHQNVINPQIETSILP